MDKEELERELNGIRNLLYKVAFSKLNNQEDTEDVISETEYLAIKHLDKLKDKKKFKYWVLEF